MHKNNKKNPENHHLHEIYDDERETAFKFGISSRPLRKDGTSPRAQQQVRLFNRVAGWLRFSGRILLKGIKGREKALDLEEKTVSHYKRLHGKTPEGNEK
jgi:hypothetical protein